jgi:hypothetical protein
MSSPNMFTTSQSTTTNRRDSGLDEEPPVVVDREKETLRLEEVRAQREAWCETEERMLREWKEQDRLRTLKEEEAKEAGIQMVQKKKKRKKAGSSQSC